MDLLHEFVVMSQTHPIGFSSYSFVKLIHSAISILIVDLIETKL